MPYFFTKNSNPMTGVFAKKPAVMSRVFSKGTGMVKPIIPSMMQKQIIGSNGFGIRKV